MEHKKTMLIVDDAEINRAILAQFFQGEYKTLEAANGQEAIDLIQHQPIDIILLDLYMPVMDGMAVLKWLNVNKRYTDIPVIVTTASNEERIEVQAMENGAADFIVKPYNHTIVTCRVKNVMGRRENELTRRLLENQNELSSIYNLIDIDPQTGLLTKSAFLQQAGEILGKKSHDEYSFLYLDIAGFHLVNELFNVETGEILIQTSASFFKTAVGRRGLACHITADTFALFLPNDMVDMDLLLQGLDAMMHSLNIYRTVYFYGGVYPIKNKYITPKQMMDKAHMAMSMAKRSREKRYIIYDDELHQMIRDNRIIAHEMENSLKNGDFFVEYQPVYKLDDRTGMQTPVQAEALLRWKHPEHGLIDPDKFIPIFEKNGFIHKIDRFAWDQACRFLTRQRDWGLKITPVSINISYINFYDMTFFDYLVSLLRRYDLQPDMLYLELSEAICRYAPDKLKEILPRLNDCGFKIILDDFDSSYQSIDILKDYKIDMLKLNLRRLYNGTNPEKVDIIVSAILKMTHGLGINTIIKAVENDREADHIKALDCHIIQGFQYSRPMNADAYIDLLTEI